MTPHRLRSKAAVRWLAALAFMLWVGQAQALCLAVVGCTCSVSTTTLSFGVYNPLSGSAATSSASMQISCGGVAGLAIPYKIDLSTGGGGSYAGRRLASGANTMSYNLYTSSNYLTVWGDGSGGTQSVTGNIGLDVLGLSPPQTHWIYARIPSGQTTTKPGTYTDTLTVTVTYY